jgi:membrane associated rhomboid family serine protease
MGFVQEPRQPFLRAPSSAVWLIALLVAAHMGRVLAPAQLSDNILVNYAFIPARYSHAYLAAHGLNPGSIFEQALPFVSYMLLHAGLAHLAINCVWLLAFGAVVARRIDALLFFLFFVLCGIAGAAVHLAFNWGSAAPVIGASGAISGLMAMGFRIVGGSRPVDGGPLELAPILSSRILIWSAVWIGVNILAGVTGLGNGAEPHLVAWQVHLGGYAAGLLLAGPFVAIQDRYMHPRASLG